MQYGLLSGACLQLIESHLFFKNLNLGFWRRKVSVEIEAAFADGDTFSTPQSIFCNLHKIHFTDRLTSRLL